MFHTIISYILRVLAAVLCREMADSTGLQFVSPYAFEAMQKVDVVRLAALSDPELRLLLPCLVRMALCAPADQSQCWAQDKKLILRLLSGVEAVNSIVALLSVDFHALEQDARKEQQLRYPQHTHCNLIITRESGNDQNEHILCFEKLGCTFLSRQNIRCSLNIPWKVHLRKCYLCDQEQGRWL